MFLIASDVAIGRPVCSECTSVTDILVDCAIRASVTAAHDDMCRVRIPPLFKDVKISLIVVHIQPLTLYYH